MKKLRVGVIGIGDISNVYLNNLKKYDAVEVVACASRGLEKAQRKAAEHGIPLISSMGTGNKLDPSLLEISDISKTAVCPLARVMRRELRQRGITRLPVLFSTEQPVRTGMRTPASISFVPSVGGLMIGGYIVRKIIGK